MCSLALSAEQSKKNIGIRLKPAGRVKAPIMQQEKGIESLDFCAAGKGVVRCGGVEGVTSCGTYCHPCAGAMLIFSVFVQL